MRAVELNIVRDENLLLIHVSVALMYSYERAKEATQLHYAISIVTFVVVHRAGRAP